MNLPDINQDDLTGALRAIVRLQETYDLSTER